MAIRPALSIQALPTACPQRKASDTVRSWMSASRGDLIYRTRSRRKGLNRFPISWLRSPSPKVSPFLFEYTRGLIHDTLLAICNVRGQMERFINPVNMVNR